jgi:L-2-hydroxyglutarate oxidase LhgO
MASEIADTIVIGAGVTGLAIARELARKGHEVLVLECNRSFGMETSSRNSGVVHAGIYYPPGSLKAHCCIKGKRLLYEYCAERNIGFARCGKIIIASSEEQHDQLRTLQHNASHCGLDDIKWLDRVRVNELEPETRASAGLFSPSTGIVDVHELMLAFLADLEASGGTLVTNTRVQGGHVSAGGMELRVDHGGEYTIRASTVINAAGHGSGGLAHRITGLSDRFIPPMYPVRGHYYEYTGKLPFSRLVYPLPGETGLGIHVTTDLAGQSRFGPDHEYCDRIDYHFDETRKQRFVAAIRDWYPGLDESRLRPGYVGVRPNLQAPGEAQADFVISGAQEHGIDGLVNLFGIDSPGLTACMALASEVARRISSRVKNSA